MYPRLALLLPALAAALAQTVVQKVEVKGVPPAIAKALIGEAGLPAAKAMTKASYDEACNRLIRTGFIQGCAYRFTENTVEFDVKEVPRTMKAVITLPGVKEEELWAWMSANEPLVQRVMPENDDATQFYIRAVERYARLKGMPSDISPGVHTDLERKQTSLRFRPSTLVPINGVVFEGVTAVDLEPLKNRIEKVAKGQGFFEPDFRLLLLQNITPEFEKLGYLGLSYPSVSVDGGGVVRVSVKQGPVYRFGNVPQPLTPGGIADWSKVQALASEKEKAARDQGYLNARTSVRRDLKNDQTADIEVIVDRGPLARFGELRFSGIDPSTEERLRREWKLRKGDALRESYPYEFLKDVSDGGLLGRRSLDLSVRFEPRPGFSDIVDLHIVFK